LVQLQVATRRPRFPDGTIAHGNVFTSHELDVSQRLFLQVTKRYWAPDLHDQDTARVGFTQVDPREGGLTWANSVVVGGNGTAGIGSLRRYPRHGLNDGLQQDPRVLANIPFEHAESGPPMDDAPWKVGAIIGNSSSTQFTYG
jgi:hypothetical protein